MKNREKAFRRVLVLAIASFSLLGTAEAIAQTSAAKTPTKSGVTAATAASLNRVEPVFPVQNENLIYVEGENAVATNFDKEPILNWNTSGVQTLQLSKAEAPASIGGDSSPAYYADYVFYVDQPGDFEFWYGGTPPGPATKASVSYTSSFSYQIDGADPVAVNREDVKVAGSYAPSYFWVRVGTVKLSRGQHRLSFQVSEKRQYDGRYFFYLDSFFFVRSSGDTPDPGTPLPPVFPTSLTDFSQDKQFRAIEDYLIDIRDHPERVQAYVDLSLIYSLVGDYLNALKYLNRAAVLKPGDPSIDLLRAKNLIWKGDLGAGLDAYRETLSVDPKRLELWAEAGKVAAWSGRYEDSIQFYNDGLKQFPGNVNLTVNEGLTYLWSGDEKRAQELFDRARRSAQNDYSRLLDLARTLTIAKAIPKAAETFQTAIQLFPKNLEGYLDLEKLYFDNALTNDAKGVQELVQKTFLPSEKLSQFLDLARIKQNLKAEVIAGYERKLAAEPDNLALRQVLAQTYLWNGMQEAGTEEYLDILVNYSYRALSSLDGDAPDLLRVIDESHLLDAVFQAAPQIAGNLRTSLEKTWTASLAARKNAGSPNAAGGSEVAVEAEVAKVLAFLDEMTRLGSVVDENAKTLDALVSTEKEAAQSFKKITESSNWQWRRADTLAEMDAARAHGVELAGYSVGKIYALEDRLASAEGVYRAAIAEGRASKSSEKSTISPLLGYELSQTLLWQGNLAAALVEVDKLPTDDNRFAAAVAWASMYRTILQSVPELSQAVVPGTRGGTTPASFRATDETRVKELIAELQKTAESTVKTDAKVRAMEQTAHDILWARMVRALYQNQQDTFSLRNELGGYYLAQKKFDEAILQFNQVLAIDPWDTAAIFRLGQVYEWKGAWSQALDNYEKVYSSDPSYENVIRRYNDLGRKHPDSLSFSGRTTADTQVLRFQGDADYTTLVNSVLGFNLHVGAVAQRLYKPPTPENVSDYQLYTFTVGVPLDLYFWKVKIEPRAGVSLSNALFNNNTVLALPLYPGANQYFGNVGVWPVGEIDASVSLGQFLYLSGTYTFARQPETFVPGRPVIYAHTGEANLTTDLGFVGGYPFNLSSLRTYGQVNLLTDGNIMITGVQEVNLGLMNLDKPVTQFSLLGSFQIQNSRNYEPTNYYTPIGVLLAGGGFQGSIWLPAGQDSVGVSLRALASSYLEHVFTPSSLIKRLQLDGEARVEYDRGNAALYLDFQFSTTYRYDPPPPDPAQGPWDYWLFTVSVGYGAQLPKLLVP
ncbi:MAG TPA: tetratricopeptide repeat protein [Spirochaetia bacterium]|nr:tetratricopeptide repeat protein [Spirochaetia bacterium]